MHDDKSSLRYRLSARVFYLRPGLLQPGYDPGGREWPFSRSGRCTGAPPAGDLWPDPRHPRMAGGLFDAVRSLWRAHAGLAALDEVVIVQCFLPKHGHIE